MLKLPLLSCIRRYRANRARIKKYPCLSIITGGSALSIFWRFTLALYLITNVKLVHDAYVANDAWSATTGTIVSTSLTPNCWWRSGPSELDIYYAYIVNERAYRGRKISFSRMACGSSEDAKAVTAFSAGSHGITVYYDPNVPSRSVLVQGFYGDDRFFFPAWFALNLLALLPIRTRRPDKSKKFREMRKHIRRVQQSRL